MTKSKRTPPRSSADLKALVRRLADVEATAFKPRRDVVAIAPLSGQQLEAAPVLGTLGLVELKLTKREEEVLSSAVDTKDVSIKPSGQPYLSHPVYTIWFNQAFGRTGWALVQTSLPAGRQDGNKAQVTAHYTLFIHGKPVAQAWGEQEYWSNNAEQSYGDALEATVASALRRCAKRLGVGLELWDKRWLSRFIHDHCVQVDVLAYDKQERARVPKKMWRRKDDPALRGEFDASTAKKKGQTFEDAERPQLEDAPTYEFSEPRPAAPARSSAAPPAAGTHARAADLISPPQNKRLFAILRNSGRNEQAFRAWLERRFGYASTADISRRDYDFICKAIESPRALPEREAGQEG